MKELSIEEKAKAYDEALKRAKILYNDKNEIGYANAESVLEEVFPLLKESEDERIRKEIINYFAKGKEYLSLCSIGKDDILAWLEKQANHANFCNKIQVGDKVTRNRDGVLVNLSQLNRVAKKGEKQGDANKEYWRGYREGKQEILGKYGKVGKCIDWVKSLKERYTWNPSDEQMKALKEAVDEHFDIDGGALWHLYEDLKKLKG